MTAGNWIDAGAMLGSLLIGGLASIASHEVYRPRSRPLTLGTKIGNGIALGMAGLFTVLFIPALLKGYLLAILPVAAFVGGIWLGRTSREKTSPTEKTEQEDP